MLKLKYLQYPQSPSTRLLILKIKELYAVLHLYFILFFSPKA